MQVRESTDKTVLYTMKQYLTTAETSDSCTALKPMKDYRVSLFVTTDQPKNAECHGLWENLNPPMCPYLSKLRQHSSAISVITVGLMMTLWQTIFAVTTLKSKRRFSAMLR